jgi:hypothetical protein
VTFPHADPGEIRGEDTASIARARFRVRVAVTDFPTKAAVIVRDDLAVWQRLNVTGFLVSGLIGSAEDRVVGEDYIDADGKHYLPMLVQPLLVLEASAAKLQTVRRRAAERDVPIAIYTAELFSTGHDHANREAVRAVSTADLDLVGIGVRAAHKDTDAILRGLRRHD